MAYRSHTRRALEEQLRLQQEARQSEGRGQIMSPEELQEEMQGWDRHRHKQKLPRENTPRSPVFPRKPSP